MSVLPGDLTSPTAGPLLRRGEPVVFAPGCCSVLVLGVKDDRVCVSSTLIDWTELTEGHDLIVPLASVALDLTDPAGMDLAARWLARHHGEKVAITAPAWTYVAAVQGREHRTADGTYIDHDEARPAMWLLICDEGTVTFAQWDPDDGPTPTEGGEGVDVWLTDWSDVPAAALALACLHAGGRQ